MQTTQTWRLWSRPGHSTPGQVGQEQAGWGFQLDLGLPITPLHQPLLPRLGLSLEEDEGMKVLVSAPGLTAPAGGRE